MRTAYDILVLVNCALQYGRSVHYKMEELTMSRQDPLFQSACSDRQFYSKYLQLAHIHSTFQFT